MDLREGRRRAVRMEAEVQTLAGDSECRASGRVRDVSLSGLYLELTDMEYTNHPTPEAQGSWAQQCEFLAIQHGSLVLRPLYRSLTASIGEEALEGMQAPGENAEPVAQARFLVNLLGEEDALRAIEGAVREHAQVLKASLKAHLRSAEDAGATQRQAGRGRIGHA